MLNYWHCLAHFFLCTSFSQKKETNLRRRQFATCVCLSYAILHVLRFTVLISFILYSSPSNIHFFKIFLKISTNCSCSSGILYNRFATQFFFYQFFGLRFRKSTKMLSLFRRGAFLLFVISHWCVRVCVLVNSPWHLQNFRYTTWYNNTGRVSWPTTTLVSTASSTWISAKTHWYR